MLTVEKIKSVLPALDFFFFDHKSVYISKIWVICHI